MAPRVVVNNGTALCRIRGVQSSVASGSRLIHAGFLSNLVSSLTVAEMKVVVELQGHPWFVGTKDSTFRTLKYTWTWIKQ
ncbi:unnamed protein product [Dovyalis caffra]|uniref:Uncharacterized protein n=1 Tax=Dovyalis caffra TaxID=77055 RepID=A0AAV1SAJ3_9ROSI|nr:unnamed protein product [Dovyalis caffra]